jgi:hypothetical protein
MMRTNGRSQAIFGGMLWGDSAVRYIFVDEAGTSAREPISVVVGLVANADEHVMSAEALVLEALRGVPSQFRDGFKFSAKTVFGDEKYQSEWSLTDRLSLLHQMMSIPSRVGMAISVAAQWRGAVDFSEGYGKLGLTPAESDHMQAFKLCLAMADRGIRREAGPREVATVVAEDHPTMKRYLKQVPTMLRNVPVHLKPDFLRQTEADREAGYLTQTGDIRVERIRSAVHFVAKEDDPLVQVADACAYGVRRFLNSEKFGVEFVRKIFGDESLLRNFASPGGCECYWPNRSSAAG